jgi:hypothetical protein
MLKQTIGENAGQVWHLLNQNGAMQLTELLQVSKIEETDFNLSLGWLAREGKIAFYEEEDKQMVILIY